MLTTGSLWPSNDIAHNHLAPAYRAPSVGESVIYWKFRNFLLRDGAVPHDVVLLGDSSCFMGVIPSDIERLTRFTAINLGVDGSYSLSFVRDVMELYLERVGRPKIAVLHLSTHFFQHGDTRNASAFAVLERRYAEVTRWVATVARGYPAVYKAGLNLNAMELVERLGATFAQRGDAQRGPFPTDAEMGEVLAAGAGFLRMPDNPTNVPLSLRPRPGSTEPLPVPMLAMLSQRTAAELDALFALAQRHEIQLLLVFHPVSDVHRVPQTEAAFASFGRKVEELAGRYSDVVAIARPILRFYPREIAYDSAHMLGDGPERNTAEIASWIAEAMRERPAAPADRAAPDPGPSPR